MTSVQDLNLFRKKSVRAWSTCGGHRYSRQALSYTYKGKNIDKVMSLTVDEALEFFDAPKIRKPLKALQDVCIGYITLRASTATLSGGGTDGGEVVFAGTPEEILKCEQSKTGKWMEKMM